jgi:hypothetical protein
MLRFFKISPPPRVTCGGSDEQTIKHSKTYLRVTNRTIQKSFTLATKDLSLRYWQYFSSISNWIMVMLIKSMYIFHFRAIAIALAYTNWNVYAYTIRTPNRPHHIFKITTTTQNAPPIAYTTSIALSSKKKDETETVPDAVTKAAWYAVETYGKIFKRTGTATTDIIVSYDQPPNSLQETQERIRKDNERFYFLSGVMDELIYSEDCTFADPFVSFQGRERFVTNLANLGSFIVNYTVRQLDYTTNDNIVDTKFMVKLQLNLPWKPILAWPWGVRCEVDRETNLIVLHKESVRTTNSLVE